MSREDTLSATAALVVEPAPRLVGHLAVPGDKSISHRAVLIGAICDGETRISGFGRSADTEATIGAVRALGIDVYEHGADTLRVFGKGLHGLAPRGRPIDCANAGTLVRLVAGILAGQEGKTFELIGDESIEHGVEQPGVGGPRALHHVGSVLHATHEIAGGDEHPATARDRRRRVRDEDVDGDRRDVDRPGVTVRRTGLEIVLVRIGVHLLRRRRSHRHAHGRRERGTCEQRCDPERVSRLHRVVSGSLSPSISAESSRRLR